MVHSIISNDPHFNATIQWQLELLVCCETIRSSTTATHGACGVMLDLWFIILSSCVFPLAVKPKHMTIQTYQRDIQREHPLLGQYIFLKLAWFGTFLHNLKIQPTCCSSLSHKALNIHLNFPQTAACSVHTASEGLHPAVMHRNCLLGVQHHLVVCVS